MRERRQNLAEIASAQGGFFTAAQAVQAGYSYRLQHLHRSVGNWEKLGHGVFRLPHFPLPERPDLIVLSLWSRNRAGEPQAVVSHESALAIYELSDVLPAKISLTVPKSFRKSPPPGCILHRRSLESSDWAAHTGYRVTTPLCTLRDMAENHLSEHLLQQAVGEALGRGLVRRKILADVVPMLTEHGQMRLRQALESASKSSFISVP